MRFRIPGRSQSKECSDKRTSIALRRICLTPSDALKENEACMQAGMRLRRSAPPVNSVTNSVTKPLGTRGQSRATVTNFVTKLRAIQGNEITTFGESRAMEGN